MKKKQEKELRNNDREKFGRFLEQASKTVSSWPEWKQGIFEAAIPEQRKRRITEPRRK